jgi:predicted HicB family RNase H-like nuclease
MEEQQMAEKTVAQKKAQQKYMEKFAVARVRMDRKQYERIQAHAAARGESVNAFIGRAIDTQMERDGGGTE